MKEKESTEWIKASIDVYRWLGCNDHRREMMCSYAPKLAGYYTPTETDEHGSVYVIEDMLDSVSKGAEGDFNFPHTDPELKTNPKKQPIFRDLFRDVPLRAKLVKSLKGLNLVHFGQVLARQYTISSN
jgi:hypothetical protein